jgi:hypothetical protein
MVFRMAHSVKSWRIFKAAVALHFVYNNFAHVHKSLSMTAAMAAGITDTVWARLPIL